MKYYDTIDTPMGSLLLLATEAGLCELDFNAKAREIEADWQHDPERLAPVIKQVGAYFAGELTDFDLPLDPQGTEFQRRVWRELCAIPFGETISYGELARRIGKPTASRAVGAANGQNPVAIIIPCHRVLGANGLGGFSGRGGVETKVWLLKHERAGGLLI